MKFAILPIIIFLTVIMLAVSVSTPKSKEAGQEKTLPTSQDAVIVNDLISRFVKSQMKQLTAFVKDHDNTVNRNQRKESLEQKGS